MKDLRYLYASIAVLALCITIPDITSSFWRDECGTVWIIKDTFYDALHRALWWSATSPLYYVVLWLWAKVFGFSEISLRIPSALFTAATSFILYHLGRFWFDRETSLLAALLFLATPSVSFSAVDARPYALGLFFLTLSWLLGIRWLSSARQRDLVYATVTSALCVYTHYLMILGLVSLYILLYYERGRRTKATLVEFTTSIVIFICLMTPLFFQLSTVYRQRNDLNWAQPLSLREVIFDMTGGYLLVCVLAGIFPVFISKGMHTIQYLRPAKPLYPIVILALLPPLVLSLLSVLGGIHLFVPRYLLTRTIGMAIILAWVIGSIGDPLARRTSVFVSMLFITFLHAIVLQTHTSEGWRQAIETANQLVAKSPEQPVAVVSGFVESNRPGELEQLERIPILYAPLTCYNLAARLTYLPLGRSPAARRQLREDFFPAAKAARRGLLLCADNCSEYASEILTLLKPVGLKNVERHSFGRVELVEFSD